MKPKSERTRGFSLIELMVVLAIVGVVVGVVAACLSGGIRVWESARILTSVEQEAYFGVEYFRRDVANTFRFSGIKFVGGESEVSFPSLIEAVDEDGASESRIGTVKYFYDPAQQTVNRMLWPYPSNEEEGEVEVIARNVQSLKFAYQSGASDERSGAWTQPTNFPAAVSMELRMSQGGRDIAVDREVPLMEDLWRDR